MIGLTKAEREKLLHDGLMRAPKPSEPFGYSHPPKQFGPRRVTPVVRETQNTPPANATMINGKWISNKWLEAREKMLPQFNNNLVKNTKT